MQPKTLSMVDAEKPRGGEVPLADMNMDWGSTNSVHDETLTTDANNSVQVQLFDNYESGAPASFLSAQDPFFEIVSNGSVCASLVSPMLPSSVNVDFDISLLCTSDDSVDFDLPLLSAESHSGRHNNEPTSGKVFGVGSNTRPQMDSRSLTYPLMTRARLPREPLRSTFPVQGSGGNSYCFTSEDFEFDTRNDAPHTQNDHLEFRDNTNRDSLTSSRSQDMVGGKADSACALTHPGTANFLLTASQRIQSTIESRKFRVTCQVSDNVMYSSALTSCGYTQ